MLYNTAENETERRELRTLSIGDFCELIVYRYAQTVARTSKKNLFFKHNG